MSDARFDVVGIGNAIVDVLSHEDDAFLTRHGMTKGTMALIDADAADKLYDDMGAGIECSGGSAANTIAGLASLGGRGAFIGKVKDDGLGKVFHHDIEAIGVHFPTSAATDGLSTARCLIHVTPDAERTMNTFLGACTDLGPDDVDEDVVRASSVTYLEGYLWDKEDAKAAFVKAAELAHDAGREVSLSLSDPFCVGRHRESFLDLVENHVDILFANEDEIKALYEVEDFDAALQQVRGHCKIAALTRGAKGSVVINGDEIHIVDCDPVDHVADTTGAGDAYAAGFLFGYTNGHADDLAHCAKIGNIAAAEIISHFGARPETPLNEVVAAKLG
ncbi:MAG: adenosine kinase [Magnetovibrio sp.]|nr:adenosine kinase [Magnetovibrio sp.]